MTGRGLVVCLATGLVLMACDPARVPDDPAQAEIDFDVTPTGDVRVDLFLAPEHQDDLHEIADQTAQTLFPGGNPTIRIDGNDGGWDYAVISLADAYEPGTSPVVRADTSDLPSTMRRFGVTHVDFSVCGPHVPTDIDYDVAPLAHDICYYWDLEPDAPAPAVTLTMNPRPLRWWFSTGLLLVALITCLVAVGVVRRSVSTHRRRITLIGAGAAGSLTVGLAIVTAAGAQADNLGVAGQLRGMLLTVASIAPLATLPLGAASFVLSLASGALTRHDRTITRP